MGQTSRALAHALSIKEQGDKVKELLGDIWLALGDLKAAEGSFLAIPEKKRSAKVNFCWGSAALKLTGTGWTNFAKQKNGSQILQAG